MRLMMGSLLSIKTSRILYVNKAYTKILAVSKDKVLHKQVKTIEPGALILQVLQNKEPVLQQLVEVKTRGKNTSQYYTDHERRYTSRRRIGIQ